MNDATLPEAIHAEVAILGAMLLDPVAVSDATGKLRIDDFSLDSHRRIYRVMLDLISAGYAIDSITVMTELKRRLELNAVGGPGYIASLYNDVAHGMNIESYVRLVKGKALLRNMLTVVSTAHDRIVQQQDEPQTLLADIEAQFAELAEGAIDSPMASIPEIVAGSFGSIDALYEHGREVTGLETRYTEFDKITSGLQPGELVIIAARPSMGKTAWAINIGQNIAVHSDKVVAVFSLEMSKESLLRRMLASEAMVGTRKIQTGFIPREDKGKLISGLDRLLNSRLYIDDTGSITLSQMRAKCRRLRQHERQLDLIIIDYLQLMTGDGVGGRRAENRTQEVSAISRGLKALAKELHVPVVALSQLSRNAEQRGGNRKPLLSDLRESGSIEQDADVVAFIHRDEYYDRDNEDLKGKAEIIIAKQRNGPTGSVHMAYRADFTRFENLERGAY